MSSVEISHDLSSSRQSHLSAAGKAVLLCLALVLFGPYLDLLGTADNRLRLDHLFMPVLAVAVLAARVLSSGKVVFPLGARAYAVFLLWLLAVSSWTFLSPAPGYPVPPIMQILAGGEAYIRPLLIMLITANVPLSREDLRAIVGFATLSIIPASLLAVLQLTPASSPVVNEFIKDWYTNGPAHVRLVEATLSGGRAMSVFGQVGTLGMYSTVALALAGMQYFVKSDPILSRRAIWLVLLSAFTGGIVSGSKVFTGSLMVLLTLVVWFKLGRRRRIKVSSRTVGRSVAALVFTGGVLLFAFPSAIMDFLYRINPSLFYESYLAPRFGENAKLLRTGAFEIFSDYPLSGLGLSVVGRTTDSLLFGVLIMGGVVGGLLYALSLLTVFWKLWLVRRFHRDQTVAALGSVMLLLGVAFLLAAIGFHTFIQDRAGDVFWLLAGILMSPACRPQGEPVSGENVKELG